MNQPSNLYLLLLHWRKTMTVRGTLKLGLAIFTLWYCFVACSNVKPLRQLTNILANIFYNITTEVTKTVIDVLLTQNFKCTQLKTWAELGYLKRGGICNDIRQHLIFLVAKREDLNTQKVSLIHKVSPKIDKKAMYVIKWKSYFLFI